MREEASVCVFVVAPLARFVVVLDRLRPCGARVRVGEGVGV